MTRHLAYSLVSLSQKELPRALTPDPECPPPLLARGVILVEESVFRPLLHPPVRHAPTHTRAHPLTRTRTPPSSAIPREEFIWNLGALRRGNSGKSSFSNLREKSRPDLLLRDVATHARPVRISCCTRTHAGVAQCRSLAAFIAFIKGALKERWPLSPYWCLLSAVSAHCHCTLG